jgi:hypothetical protein
LLQVKQLADFKTAELNAKVLQLESHIHWLQQDNQRLQEELQQTHQEAAAPDGAAGAAGGPNMAALQVGCDCSCLSPRNQLRPSKHAAFTAEAEH